MFKSMMRFFGLGRSRDQYIPSMHPKDLLNAAQSGAGAVAPAIRDAELEYIRAYRRSTGRADDAQTFGLALSGGGVRSATIALGVMQALAKAGKLERFDYLSTVSGGGYTGSSLTWFTSSFCSPPSGTSAAAFPFGVEPPSQAFVPEDIADKEPAISAEQKLLIYLRQHANYLIPGNGINVMSGVAMVLRGVLVNLFIWLPLTCFVMLLLIAANGFKWALVAAGVLALLLGFLGILYSWVSGKARLKIDGWMARLIGFISGPVANFFMQLSLSYPFRRLFDSRTRWIPTLVAILLLIGLVPHLDAGLGKWIREATVGSIVGGVVSGFWTFWQSRRSNGGGLPGFVPAIGAFLLLYGVVLGAYHAAHVMAHSNAVVPLWGAWIKPTVAWLVGLFTPAAPILARFEQMATSLLPTRLGDGNVWIITTLLAWCALAVFTAWFANLNYTTIHRYYRDRLMESFLPDRQAALENATGPANTADTAHLSDMCDPKTARGPYHIVNCNVMLNDSLTPVWRQRGGDSFMLTPRYCGSSATGWMPTRDWMNDAMTLATALSISGAAANPGTGTGGVGPTRNVVVSLLMALLNLRLGYWVANPNRRGLGEPMPNHFDPALRELLGRSRAEKERIVQLSDGGHFDNLGLYELIRRKVSLIVVSDGTADPGFAFPDLMTLLPRIRADLGTTISFDLSLGLDGVMPIPALAGTPRYPAGAPLSGRGFAIGEIRYPGGTPPGILIYLKAAALAGMETELLGYKGQVEDFPNESTIDQFYTEAKFEAHRGIGYALAEEMLRMVAPGGAGGRPPVPDLAINPALLAFKAP